MPKKNRLTGSEIRSLKPEKRLNTSLFSLSISKNGGGTRCACVVSKKVSPKAVVRNRVKRRMRAALLKTAPLPPAVSLVLTAKKTAIDADFSAIHEDIVALVHRVRSGK